jgi:hypothetical protein
MNLSRFLIPIDENHGRASCVNPPRTGLPPPSRGT